MSDTKKVFCDFSSPASTGSRGQDALKSGFLITCTEGLAELLHVRDLTVEACKEFYPRAVKEATEKMDKMLERRKNWKPEPARGFIKKLRAFLRPLQPPKFGVLYLTETSLDTKSGTYNTDIREKFADDHTEHVQSITCNAKLGKVVIESYDNYTNLLVPDHVIEDIKIATEIGLHDIKIAYTQVNNVPERDPLVIGYVDTQMFLISRFNPGEKAYPTL